MERQGSLVGFAGYNAFRVRGEQVLAVEGIALHPKIQAKGVFAGLTDLAREDEQLLCLRTQSPHMYQAMKNYVTDVYPGEKPVSSAALSVAKAYAERLGCVVRRDLAAPKCYSGFLYGDFFAEENAVFDRINVRQGDGLIVVGNI